MNFSFSSHRCRSGFNLFELLMSLAILGIILAITVPLISQSDAIYDTRNRRNAQELCSTCTMAQAVGLNFVQGEDVVQTIRAIVRGGMPAQGAMKGRLFVVPGLSEEDIEGAAKFLRIENDELRYLNKAAASKFASM